MLSLSLSLRLRRLPAVGLQPLRHGGPGSCRGGGRLLRAAMRWKESLTIEGNPSLQREIP